MRLLVPVSVQVIVREPSVVGMSGLIIALVARRQLRYHLLHIPYL